MKTQDRTCANCAHFEAEQKQCRSQPPRAHVIPVPVQTLQGPGIQIQTFSVWPTVEPEAFCGGWIPSMVPQYPTRSTTQ